MSDAGEQTALAVIPPSAISTIIAADEDDILGRLSRKVANFKQDVSTKAGRDAMRSFAREIASSKVQLLNLGKSLKEDAQKRVKAINAEERVIEARMDELRDAIRAPLTAYEEKEKARVEAHERALSELVEAPWYGQTETAAELRERLELLLNYPARDWEEFSDRFAETMADEIQRTNRLIAAADKREAEAAELARLREAEAERKRQEAQRQKEERDRQIAAQAAERARIEAERIAERDRQAVLQAAAEERARVERAAAAERARAEQAEREREAAAAENRRQLDLAEKRRIAAEQMAEAARKEAEAKAERERAAAVKAERDRIAAEQEAAEADARARATNRAIQARVSREMREDITAELLANNLEPGAILEDIASQIVGAIANGKVRHCRVEY
jgi:hypothetical protein